VDKSPNADPDSLFGAQPQPICSRASMTRSLLQARDSLRNRIKR